MGVFSRIFIALFAIVFIPYYWLLIDASTAKVPARYGGHFVIAGFELTDKQELVIYNLDMDQINQAISHKILSGQPNQSDEGDGVLVDSDMGTVFRYLDDPANSDVFSEAVRYQRLVKSQ